MNKIMIALVVFAIFQTSTELKTVDEVLAKYIAARGGVEKVRSVNTERITGRMIFAPGVEGHVLIEYKRPLKMHMEMVVQGKTVMRIYDGKSAGWVVNPFSDNPDVQSMPDEELQTISDEADFDGPLIDYKAKGNLVALEGISEQDGKKLYRVLLMRKFGGKRTYYIDASSFKVVKWAGETPVEGQTVLIQNDLGDYRVVDGLSFPFEVETTLPGATEQRKFVVEKIEINPQIDDKQFEKPVVAATPAVAQPK
jgi:outer membrane lipoprotein-sorting protein